MTNGTVTLVRCAYHPGGPVELPAEAFYESDRTRNSAMCIECRKRDAARRKAEIKAGTYVPKHRRWSPQQKPTQPTAQPAVPIVADALITPAQFVKIGGYYFAHSTILLADTLQAEKVTLHTTILEIDGETKHPRNKKLIFTKSHATEEYNAVLAYLRAASNTPAPEPSMNEQAAMQLAEEATKALAQANRQIEELKAKLDKFKALLD